MIGRLVLGTPHKPWRISAALVLAGLVVCVASPFSKIIQFTQPTGEVVSIRGQGDEFHALFQTLDGYTVVFDPARGGYCYARLDSANRLESTGWMVGTSPAPSGLVRNLRPAWSAVAAEVLQKRARWDSAMELSTRWAAAKAAAARAESGDPQLSPPTRTTLGTKVGLTLLVDFSDAVGTIPQAEVINFCNGDNYSGNGNWGSVKKYFEHNSDGKLIYTNIVTIYIRAPKAKSVYNNINEDCGDQGRLLITDALATLKALPNYNTEILPAFNALTVDGQNRVVALNVFYAGGNGGRWGFGLWPHSWTLANPIELSPGGKRCFFYQISDLGAALELGTFVHENGHMLCDFPDLYDYTGRSSGVGNWCLMAAGANGNNGRTPVQISAYLKRAAGWATTIDFDSQAALTGTVSGLPGTNFNRFYRYTKTGNSREYFLVEHRNQSGLDAAVPGTGIAVWHIDEQGDNSSVNLQPNTTHDNYEATLVQADNQWHLERGQNDGDSRDLYYLGNTSAAYRNRLSDTNSPHAHWWDGSSSGLVLHDFSAQAATMTFMAGTNTSTLRIDQHPQDILAVNGQTVRFQVQATGSAIQYRWRKGTSLLAGATNSVYLIPNIQDFHAGSYSVLVSNQTASMWSSNATLTVLPSLPLATALNTTTIAWVTDTNQPWYGQTNLSHDGHASARSYFIGHGQTNWLRTTLTGPGTLRFWWRVSSEPEADSLSLLLGSELQARITGETDWEERALYLPAGNQTVQWVYAKDGAGSGGSDIALVDQVRYSAGGTAAFFLAQPQNQSSLGGSPVTFQAAAGGTPPFACQWFLNGTPIAGANSLTYSVSSPQVQHAGVYTLSISNSYGWALSQPAVLGVVPMIAAGDNTFGQLNPSALATNPISLVAGDWHTLALDSSGQVSAWGKNDAGQCTVPAEATQVVAIAAGGYHSLALRRDGTVVAWGDNTAGQCDVPTGLPPVIAVAGGGWHSLALCADGRVRSWGDNGWGQANVPSSLSNVIAIAAGGAHNLALRANGTVTAWGDNTDASGFFAGQSTVPFGLSQVISVAAGPYYSLAIRADGSVLAWGDNSEGQCQVPVGLSQVTALAAGGTHVVALRKDGSLIGWGANWLGQLDLPTATGFTGVASGQAHTMATRSSLPSLPQLLGGRSTGATFTLLARTAPNRWTRLEYRGSLTDTNWVPLPTVTGHGGTVFLPDLHAAEPGRYYRIRQW